MTKKPLLTVFTPTYNRKHILYRTYESLCRQTNKNFCWLIVDDGSSDNTEELVQLWMTRDNGFDIRYVYKQNGGMHTAHNLAYRMIDTELNVCIDSDDMLTENAVEIIEKVWGRVKDCGVAGLIGLDADFDGTIIGTGFAKPDAETSIVKFYREGGRGDKKLVYRTDIIKQYPEYPEFEGEKLVPLSYKYRMIDRDYPLYAINEILCNVEYQADGSTNSVIRQYMQSPRGFNAFRIEEMKHPDSTMGLLKNTVHYISGCMFSGERRVIRESPRKVLTIILFPMGVFLNLYIRMKNEKKI